MTDMERIQGLWQVKANIFQGRPVIGASHYLFEGKRVNAIYPSLVGGGDWATFELDPAIEPKRLTMTYETRGKGGETIHRVHRGLYNLAEDTLLLCWPNLFGIYPDVISEKIHTVITLARDAGPLPETKRPSGKMPIDAPDLGRMTWADNYDWWLTQLEIMPGLVIDAYVTPVEGQSDMEAITVLQEFTRWLRLNEQSAREFAAAQLLGNYNDNWNDDAPITPEAFVKLLRLESVGVDPGQGAELFCEDGNLFGGHCIIVSVNENREFVDADIAG